MKSKKDVQDFVESLYSDMEKELNTAYRQMKTSRDELLKEIAMLLLIYTIVDDAINLNDKEFKDRYKVLSILILKLVHDDIKQEKQCIKGILTNTVKNTFKFYSYNYNLQDVKKIIDENFKGKHFSSRVWENEEEVAKKLKKQCHDFLRGKINVSDIKSEIEKTFNTSAYNAKRLVETEVSRCHISAFERFCRETGVKKLKYNAILDKHTCSDCKEYDGKIYEFGKQPSLPMHPMCRCYYDIVE